MSREEDGVRNDGVALQSVSRQLPRKLRTSGTDDAGNQQGVYTMVDRTVNIL